MAFAAALTSSGCVFLTTYHLLPKHSSTWVVCNVVGPTSYAIPAPPETSSWAGDDPPPILRCWLVEIRFTVSVVIFMIQWPHHKGKRGYSSMCCVKWTQTGSFSKCEQFSCFSNNTFKNSAVMDRRCQYGVMLLTPGWLLDCHKDSIMSLYHSNHTGQKYFAKVPHQIPMHSWAWETLV